MHPRDLILSAEVREDEVAQLLRSYGFGDPGATDRHLQEIAEVVGDRELVAESTELLLTASGRSADPDAAVRRLASLTERIGSPAALFRWLQELPAGIELIATLMGDSPFLGQTLIRNPESLYWLAEGDRLQRVEGPDYFKTRARSAFHAGGRDAVTSFDSLRRFKRREMLRIGAQDLLGQVRLEGIVEQISDLAEAIIDEAAAAAVLSQLPDSRGFAVLAMGKLGGRELNYSSDVDLIFLHADNTDEELVRRAARQLVSSISEFTNEGSLYRVDLRLRPMGAGGDVSYSEAASSTYYENWADTSDRLALLKCRPLAGDLELARTWLGSLTDFIFRRYLDKAAIEEIGWIKQRTDRQQRRQEARRNIKLGPGGIREIEFFVQSLQLLWAGQKPDLKTPNTLQALSRLHGAGLLNETDRQLLEEAYRFMRKLEHRLQLVSDRQTHDLPEDPDELRRTARRMGFSGESPETQLHQVLNRHREGVHRLFSSLFPSRAGHTSLQRLLLGQPTSDEEVTQDLGQSGFEDATAVLTAFRTLAASTAYPHSPSRVRNLLANLAPGLLAAGARGRTPHLLTGLDNFSAALGARGDLYLALVENEQLATRLFRILADSEFLASRLIHHPEVFDSLASPDLELDPARSLDPVEPGDPDAPDLLRRLKSREEFKIGAAALLDGHWEEVPPSLTVLAEGCLELALERALLGNPDLGDEPIAVVGLGKLGGRELTLQSDLDLVVLLDDTRSSTDPSRLLPLIQSVRSTLHEYTRYGTAYEVDLRLRPEGRKGLEVTPLSRLRSYFEDRADSWEGLAWRKRRIVVSRHWQGSAADLFPLPPLGDEKRDSLNRVRVRKESELTDERSGKAFDLKNGRGGLLDIQFVLGWAQAAAGLEEPSPLKALESLSGSILSPDDRTRLRNAYEFLSRLEIALELLEERADDRISTKPDDNEHLASAMDLASGQELLERYREATDANRQMYEQIFS